MSVNLGQVAAILYGTTAPSNTNVIWCKTTTNDPGTWAVVDFYVYSAADTAWVAFSLQERLLHNPADAIPLSDVRGRVIGSATSPDNSASYSFDVSVVKEGASVIIFHNHTAKPTFIDDATSSPLTIADLTDNNYSANNLNIIVFERLGGEYVLTNVAPPKDLIKKESISATRQIEYDDKDAYLRLSAASAQDVEIPLISSLNNTTSFEFVVRQGGAGALTITGVVGVTLQGSATTNGQHTSIHCKLVEPNVWDLTGGV